MLKFQKGGHPAKKTFSSYKHRSKIVKLAILDKAVGDSKK
jgi:hypothetical protein